jgi:acylpyruvate hydrolase
MRLVTFSTGRRAHLGALVDDYVVDLPAAYLAYCRVSESGSQSDGATFPTDLPEFLRGGEPVRAAATQLLTWAATPDRRAALAQLGLALPANDVTFLPPIQRPGKIICLGHNYRHHIQEMGSKMPEHPVIFAKFANTLIGHRQPIVLPRISTMVDYEAEFMLVVGTTGKDIAPTDAFAHIGGYTIFNDVSVRDYQRRTVEWLQGKTFDGTGPVGPALVTVDEIADPHALDITLRLNGEVMQHSSTGDFIFDIPTIVSYLSQIMTLEPGDLIATGTPSGVGFARNPQVFLKPGDVVQIEVAQLGVLENPVVGPM